MEWFHSDFWQLELDFSCSLGSGHQRHLPRSNWKNTQKPIHRSQNSPYAQERRRLDSRTPRSCWSNVGSPCPSCDHTCWLCCDFSEGAEYACRTVSGIDYRYGAHWFSGGRKSGEETQYNTPPRKTMTTTTSTPSSSCTCDRIKPANTHAPARRHRATACSAGHSASARDRFEASAPCT